MSSYTTCDSVSLGMIMCHLKTHMLPMFTLILRTLNFVMITLVELSHRDIWDSMAMMYKLKIEMFESSFTHPSAI